MLADAYNGLFCEGDSSSRGVSHWRQDASILESTQDLFQLQEQLAALDKELLPVAAGYGSPIQAPARSGHGLLLSLERQTAARAGPGQGPRLCADVALLHASRQGTNPIGSEDERERLAPPDLSPAALTRLFPLAEAQVLAAEFH